MILVCARTGCGAEYSYDPARPTRVYCCAKCGKLASDSRRQSDKNAARDAKREAHKTEFIGVDGEGMDVQVTEEMWDEELGQMVMRTVRRHIYVLVSAGAASYHDNGNPLTHEGIFRFLYDQKLAHPDAAFVGFFLGYDFAQWLRTLPESRAFLLLHPLGIKKRQPRNETMRFPFPVYCRGWELDILAMKRLKLRPHVKRSEWPQCVVAHKAPEQIAECAAGKHNRHPYEWMYICDAGAFFQTSLMNAIDRKKWVPGSEVVTEDEQATLQTGKDNRATAKFGPDMVQYNVLENAVLSRLMDTVNEGFMADGIRLKTNQWFGPGQAAQAWMRLIGLPTGNEVREAVPSWAIEAARQSYFGGWFEIMMHGPVPGITHSYDINSAYPYGISLLPCLMHGRWSYGTGPAGRLPRGSYQLVDARVVGKDEYIGAMPHRDRAGRIVRPQKTSGWYWQHELDAARRAGVVARVNVDQWVRYDPCNCAPPVAAIADLYVSRLRVNKDSPYGKSKKLVYNSAYGKFAQSVGQPRFSNSIYASLITAHCRMMILDAIATHPDKTRAVAMVATDSVTFMSPHPSLDVDKTALGKWGASTYQNLSLMMPGLYWDDSSRETVRKGDTPRLKSRGVSAKDLSQFIDRIDQQWRDMYAQLEWWPAVHGRELWGWKVDEAPEIDINVAFSIVSPKLAMHRDKWEECGMVQWDTLRRLSANPTGKRSVMYPAADFPGVIRSKVYDEIQDEPRSIPYDKTFGADLEEDQLRPWEEMLTPDGTAGHSLRGVIPQ